MKNWYYSEFIEKLQSVAIMLVGIGYLIQLGLFAPYYDTLFLILVGILIITNIIIFFLGDARTFITILHSVIYYIYMEDLVGIYNYSFAFWFWIPFILPFYLIGIFNFIIQWWYLSPKLEAYINNRRKQQNK